MIVKPIESSTARTIALTSPINTASGLVSESTILDAILEGKHDLKAEEVMKEAPPVVDKKSSSTLVSELLKFYPLVLVADKAKKIGLITKSDILQKVYK